MFELYTILVALVVLVGMGWGLFVVKDTLHPLVYLMPMVGFIYVYMPLSLYNEQALLFYFSEEELVFVQAYNLLCIVALAIGCVLSSKRIRRIVSDPAYVHDPYWQKRFHQFALGLGAVGLLAFVYQLGTAGGFVDAYSRAKGGGSADSGYIRDAIYLVVPALVFFYLSRLEKSWSVVGYGIAFLLSSPLLVHGLLSARRGPTFFGLVVLLFGWYLVRRTRPRPAAVIAGGVGLGILLLVLVAFRGQIYIGSDFLKGDTPGLSQMVDDALAKRTGAHFENEYMYGTYAVHNAKNKGEYWFGRRYLTQIFVRPIPRAIWPTKYEDVGMEAIETNAGILGREGREAHPGIPEGAAPGFAADAFVEWGWGGVIFSFLVGWLYGHAWQRSTQYGGIWIVHYTALAGLSVYFVAQSFLAVLFRYLLVILPAVALWMWAKREYTNRRASQEKRPSATSHQRV